MKLWICHDSPEKVYNQHPRQKTHRVHLSKAAIFAARSYPFHQDVSPVRPTTHHCYGAAGKILQPTAGRIRIFTRILLFLSPSSCTKSIIILNVLQNIPLWLTVGTGHKASLSCNQHHHKANRENLIVESEVLHRWAHSFSWFGTQSHYLQ